MRTQDLLPLCALKICTDYLKGLVVIKGRVKLQRRIGNCEAGLFKRFLETVQALRHTINERVGMMWESAISIRMSSGTSDNSV